MTVMDIPVEAVAARKARVRRDVGELDYKRSVVRLKSSGATQKAIAQMIEVSQPTVHKLLKNAATVPMPVEGFSGADPYEICERYAADLISRKQLVDELSRWEYVPQQHTVNEFDDLLFDVPGSVDDLERALRRGLIDDELFDEIADRIQVA